MKNVLRVLCVTIALAAGAQVVWAYSYDDRFSIATENDAYNIIRLIELQQNFKGASDEEIQNDPVIQAEFPEIKKYADFQTLIDKATASYSRKIKQERETIKILKPNVRPKKTVEEPTV